MLNVEIHIVGEACQIAGTTATAVIDEALGTTDGVEWIKKVSGEFRGVLGGIFGLGGNMARQ